MTEQSEITHAIVFSQYYGKSRGQQELQNIVVKILAIMNYVL